MTAACYYIAPFHVPTIDSATPLGTLTLRHTGETDIVVTLGTLAGLDVDSVASSWFFHFFTFGVSYTFIGNDPNGTVRYRHYATTSLGHAVALYVQTQQLALGWPNVAFEMQWYETTAGGAPLAHYRMTNTTAFTYQFSTLAGANLFGFNSTSLSSSATTFSSVTPPYCVQANLNQVSTPSEDFDGLDYEPNGIATLVQSDTGIAYGNARLVSPLYRNWLQQFETKEKLYRQLVTAPGWSFQHLFEYCRSGLPFLVANGGFAQDTNYELFMLRDEGNFFKPRSASIANHAQIHLPFRCLSIGALTVPS